MRKLVVGLVTAGLLTLAGSAMAQTSDPLGLISSGAVIPYVGNGTIAPGSLSFLEVTSPVGANNGAPADVPSQLHMFFFDVNCTKGTASKGLSVSENSFDIERIDTVDGNAKDGLITIGWSNSNGTGLIPVPDTSAFTARVIWADAVTNTARVLEPISIVNAEYDQAFGATDTTTENQAGVWNPLRTGASFWAPPEASGFHTTLYLICPNRNITPGAASAFPSFPARTAPTAFPPLFPAPSPDVSPSLLVRTFTKDETFARDGSTSCTCLTATPITSISGIGDLVSDPSVSPQGTLTELEGNSKAGTNAVCDLSQTGPGNANGDCRLTGDTHVPCSAVGVGSCTQFRIVTPGSPAEGPVVFTGYRAITIAGFDIFGRLNGASSAALANSQVVDGSLRGTITGATEAPPADSGR
jgi:hypothetical protein